MARRKRGTLLKGGLWALAVGLVFAGGMYWFPREYPELGRAEAFYYTLRLFILEHDLPEFPRSVPLVLIYFAAPAVALSALGTLINYLFRLTPLISGKFRSGHVIVCGVGRTGRLLAETFRERSIPVVGVDAADPETLEDWSSRLRIPVIQGDFLTRPGLEKAGIERARAVFFAAGDDLVNLEGAIGAHGWLEGETDRSPTIWTHIFTERLADMAREALRTDGRVRIRFFDTYRMAVERMVGLHFDRAARADVREVAILGFGKFGRDLLEVLLRDWPPDPMPRFRVVDVRDRGREVARLAESMGFAERVRFDRMDIDYLTLNEDARKAFFVCTDDDIGNLAVALALTRDARGTHVFVRMSRWPMAAIAEHFRERGGIHFVNINDLVREGVARLPGIFEAKGEAGPGPEPANPQPR
jgi:voltage-gated potassium channel Kch